MGTLVLDEPIVTTEKLIQKLYQTEGEAEIVNGELTKFMSTGDEPSSAAFNIAVSLKLYQQKVRFGRAYTNNAGFLIDLPNRKSFSPDASFFIGERRGMKFLQGAPIFAVEVRSEKDYGKKAEKEISEKRADYFAAGTEIVWDVDLLNNDVIKSFHRDHPDQPKIFRRGEIADVELALPNWNITVDELFD